VKKMPVNRDEMRRQLREADREQRESIAAFRDVLHRVFQSKDIPTAAKAELLGVPHRRQFLKIGGATILGAAVLAACGEDDPEGAGETGVTTASTSSTTAPPKAGDPEMDVVLARTAASLEYLAVLSYSVVLGDADVKLPAPIEFDPVVVDAATLFRTHHQAHADAVNAVLTEAGEDEYTDPNSVLLREVVQPSIANLTNQDNVVSFARDLENLAAGTYAYAAGALSTPELRQTIMSIGGVEARHATALSIVLDPTRRNASPSPTTDAGPEGRVPDNAVLTDEVLESESESG
jgi:Ferritin-like domain/TAT (twin-arginine translocation) pathway signal sequence